jgi:hypothetical protein
LEVEDGITLFGRTGARCAAHLFLSRSTHIGTARLRIKIASILRLTTEFMFLRTESPLPRADGTEPKSNDYQLVVSLGGRAKRGTVLAA